MLLRQKKNHKTNMDIYNLRNLLKRKKVLKNSNNNKHKMSLNKRIWEAKTRKSYKTLHRFRRIRNNKNKLKSKNKKMLKRKRIKSNNRKIKNKKLKTKMAIKLNNKHEDHIEKIILLINFLNYKYFFYKNLTFF